jgi:hypothetical protein
MGCVGLRGLTGISEAMSCDVVGWIECGAEVLSCRGVGVGPVVCSGCGVLSCWCWRLDGREFVMSGGVNGWCWRGVIGGS